MKKDPWFRNRLIRDGIYKAIHEEMKVRPEIFLLGEGAHMKVHFDSPAIEKDFPERVITMPISEDANSNFAVGMSLTGVVPIVDVISSDFLYRTMDAICNTMAKAAVVGHARTMIVRAEFMTGGPTSGQRIEALFAHVPGLRVVVPSNPEDAYDLMKDALSFKGVTVFFEDRMIEDLTMPEKRSWVGGDGQAFGRSGGDRLIGYGARMSKVSGPGDVVVASYGITLRRVEDVLAQENATIVDLRSLWPLDIEAVVWALDSHLGDLPHHCLLVVEPDVQFLGIGAELVAQVVERMPGVRVKRLGAPRATIPASRDLHDRMLPSGDDIMRAFKELASP